jgi:hypothetical protein
MAGGVFFRADHSISLTRGFLAGRFSKRSVSIWTKFLEMALMVLAFSDWPAKALVWRWRRFFLPAPKRAVWAFEIWIVA